MFKFGMGAGVRAQTKIGNENIFVDIETRAMDAHSGSTETARAIAGMSFKF